MKVFRKSDGEEAVCRGCKKNDWLLLTDTSRHRKYICNRCGSKHTIYTDPRVWSHQ